MTPEEVAIERIEALRKLGKLSDTVDTIVAIEIAIEALKEIQQYRKIGTVEECREMASIISKVERNELAKIIDEWLLYKKIGTVEECREAVERARSLDAYVKQVCWERDLAVQQLSEIGISLGENMDTVKEALKKSIKKGDAK